MQTKKEVYELSEKIKLISTKRLTKDLINKFRIFNGAKCFSKNGLQNNFVYQVSIRYFKLVTNNYTVKKWESIGLLDRTIKLHTVPDNTPNPILDYFKDTIFDNAGISINIIKNCYITYKVKS